MFGLFKKKPAAAAPDPRSTPPFGGDGKTDSPGVVMITTKALLVSLLGILAQQIAQLGIEATTLAVLPPALKVGISLAAPLVAAYLAKSPRK